MKTRGGGGSPLSSPLSWYATLPLRALRAHSVTKGQWLQAIHRVAPKAPETLVPFAGAPRECKG